MARLAKGLRTLSVWVDTHYLAERSKVHERLLSHVLDSVEALEPDEGLGLKMSVNKRFAMP